MLKTKFARLLGLGLLFLGLVLIVPKLSFGPATHPTIIYEGTTIQFPPQTKVPSITEFQNARRDAKKALLLLRWQGLRTFAIEWHAGGNYQNDDPVPATATTAKEFTTWAVIVAVRNGYLIGVGGYPKTDQLGFVECIIYYNGAIVEQIAQQQAGTSCDYLVGG